VSTTEFTPGSWNAAAAPFEEVSGSIPGSLQSVIASTTDANAIGSASGISLFDTAVTGVLSGLAQVMEELGTSLSDGLTSEAGALTATGAAYADTEQDNTINDDAFSGGA